MSGIDPNSISSSSSSYCCSTQRCCLPLTLVTTVAAVAAAAFCTAFFLLNAPIVLSAVITVGTVLLSSAIIAIFLRCCIKKNNPDEPPPENRFRFEKPPAQPVIQPQLNKPSNKSKPVNDDDQIDEETLEKLRKDHEEEVKKQEELKRRQEELKRRFGDFRDDKEIMLKIKKDQSEALKLRNQQERKIRNEAPKEKLTSVMIVSKEAAAKVKNAKVNRKYISEHVPCDVVPPIPNIFRREKEKVEAIQNMIDWFIKKGKELTHEFDKTKAAKTIFPSLKDNPIPSEYRSQQDNDYTTSVTACLWHIHQYFLKMEAEKLPIKSSFNDVVDCFHQCNLGGIRLLKAFYLSNVLPYLGIPIYYDFKTLILINMQACRYKCLDNVVLKFFPYNDGKTHQTGVTRYYILKYRKEMNLKEDIVTEHENYHFDGRGRDDALVLEEFYIEHNASNIINAFKEAFPSQNKNKKNKNQGYLLTEELFVGFLYEHFLITEDPSILYNPDGSFRDYVCYKALCKLGILE